jgi:transcriptional regulator with XRE-family HTH domain
MTDDQKDGLAARLRALRNDRGWSQAELARRAGLNRNVVNTTERALSVPSPENLVRMARALGVEPKDLTDAVVEAEIRRARASFEVTEIKGRPDFAHVQVNRILRSATAARIYQLIVEDGAGDPAPV